MAVIPKTLKVDSSGDLDFSSGGLVLTTSLEQFAAQKFDEWLNFYLGEWFLDTRLGFPYFRHVIGRRTADLRLIESLFLRVFERAPFVRSVLQLGLEFNSRTRALALSFKVLLNDGSVVGTLEPFNLGIQ
jgi:hypothetical protein